MTPLDSPLREVQWQGKTAVAYAEGDVDLRSSARFQNELMAVLAQSPARLVLDLRDVKYMDSSGIAGLVKLLSRTKQQGIELRLCELTNRVRSLFQITRLDSVFTLNDTQEQALA